MDELNNVSDLRTLISIEHNYCSTPESIERRLRRLEELGILVHINDSVLPKKEKPSLHYVPDSTKNGIKAECADNYVLINPQRTNSAPKENKYTTKENYVKTDGENLPTTIDICDSEPEEGNTVTNGVADSQVKQKERQYVEERLHINSHGKNLNLEEIKYTPKRNSVKTKREKKPNLTTHIGISDSKPKEGNTVTNGVADSKVKKRKRQYVEECFHVRRQRTNLVSKENEDTTKQNYVKRDKENLPTTIDISDSKKGNTVTNGVADSQVKQKERQYVEECFHINPQGTNLILEEIRYTPKQNSVETEREKTNLTTPIFISDSEPKEGNSVSDGVGDSKVKKRKREYVEECYFCEMPEYCKHKVYFVDSEISLHFPPPMDPSEPLSSILPERMIADCTDHENMVAVFRNQLEEFQDYLSAPLEKVLS